MTGPRDWDKELAAIDRAIERGPAASAGPPAAEVRDARSPATRGAGGRAWARLLPVLALAVALPFWPYARACGLGLVLYLGAVATLIGAGAWAAASAWRHRRPAAHVLALAVVAWGGMLVAREVLPRIGYARVATAWTC
ncbi:MAG: hypothetical protein ACREOC_05975 [Gemmatimonadales bacterium]